jgi:CheY-like chemotaxis protein
VALLAELAEDLAFGIQTVRARSAEAQEVRGLRNDAERDARGRLAASLHDGVGQTLQALNLGLKQAREMARRQEAVPMELLEQLVAEAGDALREVRVVSCELRPPFLEHLPLPDAVRLHCGEMAQRSGRSIRVDVDESPIVLDDRVKEQCFLAFREALSNALRHARASRILVALRVRPQKRLILVVMDDGVGFDTRQAFVRPAGLGLCMIRERAESVRGCACIRSAHGSGTQVRINVPLSRGGLTRVPRASSLPTITPLSAKGLPLCSKGAGHQPPGPGGRRRGRLGLIETHQPDIAILDLAMPRATGIEVARRVEAAALDTRVVLLTMHDDAATALQAQQAGVTGFVIKDNSFEELALAVRSVAAGGTFVTPAVRAKLNGLRRSGQRPVALSPREREVVRLIAGEPRR